jgi:hypothetical protein
MILSRMCDAFATPLCSAAVCADLAGVALTVVGGELLDETADEFVLAAEEDPLPRDEDVVENDEGLMAAEEEVPPVEGRLFQFPGIARLAAEDVGDPRGVTGEREGDRVIPVRLPHRDRRHHDDLVGVHRAGLVGLRPADDDPVCPPFHHVEVEIGVRLGVRRKRPVPLRVGHRAVAGQVVLLHIFQEIQKTAVVVRLQAGVEIVRRDRQRVQRIHPDAALKTASRE